MSSHPGQYRNPLKIATSTNTTILNLKIYKKIRRCVNACSFMGNQQNTFFKKYFAANRGKPKLSNMGPVSPISFSRFTIDCTSCWFSRPKTSTTEFPRLISSSIKFIFRVSSIVSVSSLIINIVK